MYRCIIVDDEELARKLIKRHLSELKGFELVASCESALEALKILKEEDIDLMFLDIEMPLLTGTDFLKNLMAQPKVIFTTAYREYALEGYELNVIDYLLKPINFSRFFKAIEKFLETQKKRSENSKDEHIYIRSNKKNIKIVLNDILFVESMKDYIQIHFNTKKILFKGGITAFEQKLNHQFLRVHRSYIVNLTKVTAYTKSDIEIGKIEIPISNSYKEKVFKELN
ncbi:LytR/AlgR family response regulator transcription factor [Aquimarina megaterium]|uniref:LytR/AlgR family response regulator transcription factor n=1 Tax=Aquimarina megaterium TaxID=1443666 RepID=UPI0004708D45|nr:LytTR family DNA-binding domain-containing protein [Aquimarina megaterium]